MNDLLYIKNEINIILQYNERTICLSKKKNLQKL
jgi:hypothetical protein